MRAAAAENWPTWRGPAMTGVTSEKSLPLKWSAQENVRWRVELPGPGNSSPIVWGEGVVFAVTSGPGGGPAIAGIFPARYKAQSL